MRSLVTLFLTTFATVGALFTWIAIWNGFFAARPLALRLPVSVALGLVLLTPFAAILGALVGRGVPAHHRRAAVSAWAGAIWAAAVILLAGAFLIDGG